MTEKTDRYGMPFILPGQAQKEVAHNEALIMIDALLQTGVVATTLAAPPANPVIGSSWIVGANATGDWSGKTHMVASYTQAGWRYFDPPVGFAVWSVADSWVVRRTSGGWSTGALNAAAFHVGGTKVIGARQAAITHPTGGSTIDVEARVAISAVITALKAHGMVET
jgi:Protein of unknown function (DUF2793)